jgi:hypothetical protein
MAWERGREGAEGVESASVSVTCHDFSRAPALTLRRAEPLIAPATSKAPGPEVRMPGAGPALSRAAPEPASPPRRAERPEHQRARRLRQALRLSGLLRRAARTIQIPVPLSTGCWSKLPHAERASMASFAKTPARRSGHLRRPCRGR